MRYLGVVLFIIPFLAACDPLQPHKFVVDAHNDSVRGISVDFILQGDKRIGPVRVAGKFEVDLLTNCDTHDTTSPCSDYTEVSVTVVAANTNNILAPSISCSFYRSQVNTITFSDRYYSGLQCGT